MLDVSTFVRSSRLPGLTSQRWDSAAIGQPYGLDAPHLVGSQAVSVLLLATGGTIASQPRAGDGAVTASLKGADLLASTGVDASAVDVVDIAHGPSWNFEPEFQAEVAWTARQALVDGRASGVVVTHGTDTVEETLWLTELLAREATVAGPIVFTAAMRHAAETAAEGRGTSPTPSPLPAVPTRPAAVRCCASTASCTTPAGSPRPTPSP